LGDEDAFANGEAAETGGDFLSCFGFLASRELRFWDFAMGLSLSFDRAG